MTAGDAARDGLGRIDLLAAAAAELAGAGGRTVPAHSSSPEEDRLWMPSPAGCEPACLASWVSALAVSSVTGAQRPRPTTRA